MEPAINNKKLVDNPNVVAIVETGLDYHYERKKQHRLIQKLWFIFQLKIAKKKQLPVILHIRDAHKDAQKILKRYRPLNNGIVHCFNGTLGEAKWFINLGLKIGIGGSLFHNKELETVAKEIPLEAMVLETDGPYVKVQCPMGISKKQWQKTRNTSLIIPIVAQKIAEIKEVSVLEVETTTTNNVLAVFKKIKMIYSE